MARNSEKAQSMLFRFREAQAAELGIIDAARARRPRAIGTVDTIPEAEKWRGQVLKEISRKVSRIQDVSLSDFQVRDLNDEINRLMREKHAWEVQIRNLGGANYAQSKVMDDADMPGIGGKGYKYFGRARELPGVKEMFEAARKKVRDANKEEEERKDDLRKFPVDAAYYGYSPDYETDEVLAYEADREKEAVERLLRKSTEQGDHGEPQAEWEPLPGDGGDGQAWQLPTAEEVVAELLERRKTDLLEQL